MVTDFLGGENIAGMKMKSAGIQYWKGWDENATNESGFSGLPGVGETFMENSIQLEAMATGGVYPSSFLPLVSYAAFIKPWALLAEAPAARSKVVLRFVA